MLHQLFKKLIKHHHNRGILGFNYFPEVTFFTRKHI